MTFQAAFYRGTRPGIPGLYNRLVRAWDDGPHSHVELMFSDGFSASSSFEDDGVRFKLIKYTSGDWDFILLPDHLERSARQYFVDHKDDGYDLPGNLHFVFAPIKHSRGAQFCSEAVAAALGLADPWRFTPNSLHAVLRLMEQTNQLSRKAA